MTRGCAFDIRSLSKAYGEGVVANSDISLTIQRGDLIAILGPNGAGKTTLVRQMLGLTPPTTGTIRLFGVDVVARPRYPSEVCAFLPQMPYPVREVRVAEAVALSAALRGLSRSAAKDATDQELERWGLEPKSTRRVGRLSGGERRLVGIACSLVGDREVVVMDEPTNELDPEMRARVWRRLGELATAGKTVVVITHNVYEVEGYVERVLIIDRGRVIADSTLAELTSSTSSRRVQISATYTGKRHRFGRFGEASLRGDHLELSVDTSRLREALKALAEDHNVDASSLALARPRLHDLYLDLVTNGPSETEAVGA